MRDQKGYVTEENAEEISKELGDVLWYVSALASEINLRLSCIAEDNVKKLQSRKERGSLQGSGDNR
jgi:NTP pyrophosphatase (non-canonical NTP hydrolase)